MTLVPVPMHIQVGPKWAGTTLLAAVRRAFPDVSPRDIFRKARGGEILRNQARCAPQDVLAEGDLVTVVVMREPPVAEKPVLAADRWVPTPVGPVHVVREDEDLLVVCKASGCPSHPALGRAGDTLIERVRRYLGVGPEDAFQPALANRLDVDTSGLVLVGKNRQAQRKLGLYFQRGRVEKRYLALFAGSLPDAGEITAPLDLKPDSRALAKFSGDHPRLSPRWQEAHTRYVTLFRSSHPLTASLAEVELLTGRNHQIRRHFAGIGHPVALDRRYGDAGFNRDARDALGLSRMFLHAWRIRLHHPVGGAPLDIACGLPDDLAQALRGLGGGPDLLPPTATAD